MAPELNEKVEYHGEQVDYYAAGILLFCMRTGTTPFIRCVKSDKQFELFHKDPDTFWELFSSMLGDDNYFSPEFIHLLNWML